MIITLIFLGIFGLNLILAILSFCFGDDEETATVFGCFGLVGFIGSIVCGGIAISNNVESRVEEMKYVLNERVTLLESRKTILLSYHPVNETDSSTVTSDITLEVISTSEYYNMVDKYNTSVYDFKTEVKSGQLKRKNPWISWFHNPAYLSISDATLNSLTYTVGK